MFQFHVQLLLCRTQSGLSLCHSALSHLFGKGTVIVLFHLVVPEMYCSGKFISSCKERAS